MSDTEKARLAASLAAVSLATYRDWRFRITQADMDAMLKKADEMCLTVIRLCGNAEMAEVKVTQ